MAASTAAPMIVMTRSAVERRLACLGLLRLLPPGAAITRA